MEYKWVVLTVTTIGTLIAGIDARIVVIGLPTIAQQLHANAEEVIWVTQSYILSSTVGLLLIGRIADLYGRVKLFVFGFAVFTAGSALCALALDSSQLILFRGFQGFGAGVMLTGGSALVTDASPRGELGTMLGVNQAAFRAGNVSGLTLSGLILSLVDWRGLFYVNVPIGIVGTIWAQRRLREISTRDPSRKIDWAGFTLFSVGLTLSLVAVTFLSYGEAGFAEGLGILFVGLALMAVFVKVESRSPSPVLDLSLFRIRLFAGASFSQVLNAFAWFGIILLMAFYLQVGLGYTPLQAGLGVLPLDGAFMISTLVSGRLSDRYGTRALSTLGLLINTVAFFIISTFSGETQYSEIALVLITVGLGNGIFNTPNSRAIMGSVPPNRRGIASGFRSTMYLVGSAASYGLVLLFLTLAVPFNSLSLLLQGGGSQALAAARSEFLAGFRIAAVAIAIIDGMAMIPSAMRGSAKAEV